MIYLFLGDFDSNPTTWPILPNMVGSLPVFGQGEDTPCEKCREDSSNNLIVTGVLLITRAPMDDVLPGKVASINIEDIKPYLEGNLHWRVTLLNGTESPRDQVPGLAVLVSSNEIGLTVDDVPVYSGDATLHPSITNGRAGGFNHGDPV
jgi:tyrosinase